MIDTEVQRLPTFFCRKPESKYFSPLGFIRSVLHLFQLCHSMVKAALDYTKAKGHGHVSIKLNLQKQEAS